jgi:hypothetical protein
LKPPIVYLPAEELTDLLTSSGGYADTTAPSPCSVGKGVSTSSLPLEYFAAVSATRCFHGLGAVYTKLLRNSKSVREATDADQRSSQQEHGVAAIRN